MPALDAIFARALQEYLEALAGNGEPPARRKRVLLFAYSELQYKIRRGSRCAVCDTPVRHVIPVYVERANGTRLSYFCLCIRCLEAEKAVSRRVVQRIGEAMMEHFPSGRDYKLNNGPHPQLTPIRKVRRAAAG